MLFWHHGPGLGYAEIDLAHAAQTWAMVMDRLAKYSSRRGDEKRSRGLI